MNRDTLYLQHVLDAIGKIERYVAVGYAEFIAASHWQDAVIRQLDPWKEERFSSQETKEAYQVRRRAKELGILPGE